MVELGEGSQATVVELFVSGEGPLLVVPITDISVGDAATLSYNVIQQLGAESWQLGHQRIRAGRDATLRTFTASLGGQYARFRTESVLAGQGAPLSSWRLTSGMGPRCTTFVLCRSMPLREQ